MRQNLVVPGRPGHAAFLRLSFLRGGREWRGGGTVGVVGGGRLSGGMCSAQEGNVCGGKSAHFVGEKSVFSGLRTEDWLGGRVSADARYI